MEIDSLKQTRLSIRMCNEETTQTVNITTFSPKTVVDAFTLAFVLPNAATVILSGFLLFVILSNKQLRKLETVLLGNVITCDLLSGWLGLGSLIFWNNESLQTTKCSAKIHCFLIQAYSCCISGSAILSLVALNFEKYIKICHPFWYHRIFTKF